MVIHRSLISGYTSGGRGGGSGTPADPYQVWSADDLNQIRPGSTLYPNNPLSSHYIQMADIDLSIFASGEGWNPIGTTDNIFHGSYNGNNFKISNLTINRPTADFQSLFGYCENSEYFININIENISVEGNYNSCGLISELKFSIDFDKSFEFKNIKANYCDIISNERYTAILIGRIFSNYNNTIIGTLDFDNIEVINSNIIHNSDKLFYSGICFGEINGSYNKEISFKNFEINNCSFTKSGVNLGILCGYISNFEIVILDINIDNILHLNGGITIGSYYGIIGAISSCSSLNMNNVIVGDGCDFSELYGIMEYFGMIGSSAILNSGSIKKEFIISNCVNYANLYGKSSVGSIIGSDGGFLNTSEWLIKIEYCLNYGNILGTGNNIGGCFGKVSIGQNWLVNFVRYCGSYGNITTSGSYCGGFAGSFSGDIFDCFSWGNVHGGSYVGGFVGNGNGGRIYNCYSLGIVSANTTTYVRGFYGRYGTYYNCYCSDRCNQTNSGGTGATIIADSLMRSSDIPGTTVYVTWDNTIWNKNTDLLYPILYWMTDKGIIHPYDLV